MVDSKRKNKKIGKIVLSGRYKVSKKLNEIKDIAGDIAIGDKSIVKIAEEHGIVPSTVYRLMKKEQVKELIEQQSQELVRCIPKAVENIKGLVEDFAATMDKVTVQKDGSVTKEIINKLDKDDRKLAYDATKKVLEAPGLLGGGIPSVIIGKLTVNQQNNMISPVVMELLKQSTNVAKVVTDIDESATIDAEFETVVVENGTDVSNSDTDSDK